MTTAPLPTAIRTPAEVSAPASEPRRLRRFAVHGPRGPRCGGPLAAGEGARLCAVCGYLESRAEPIVRASARPAA
jgi:hypothetical protein